METLRLWAASAIVLLLSACGSESNLHVAPNAVGAAPAATARLTAAVSEATFVTTNGSIDLFVIRSSKLALERSSSPRIRDLASRMIEAHKGTSAQLSLAGRRLNLLPSATLQSTEQAMLDALQSSGRFDAEYVRDQRIAHQHAVAIDAAYAESGQSPTLRAVAAAALPVEQSHLRLINNL